MKVVFLVVYKGEIFVCDMFEWDWVFLIDNFLVIVKVFNILVVYLLGEDDVFVNELGFCCVEVVVYV